MEKGLDVIELLAGNAKPMNLAAISERLRRSPHELFRMLQVLQARGFVSNDRLRTGYRLTEKLFALAMVKPPINSLETIALPIMRELAECTAQPCHLVVPAGREVVVVARQEDSIHPSFALRLGYRNQIVKDTAGLVLLAFQSGEVQNAWVKSCDLDPDEEIYVANAIADIRESGVCVRESRIIRDVTELAAPVLSGDEAIAALSLLFTHRQPLSCDVTRASRLLREAAVRVGAALVYSGPL